MRARLLGLSLLAAAVAAIGFAADDRAAAAGERRLTIFYTAEVHGTPEPCGCTSDPLGDVARYAALVRTAARRRPGAAGRRGRAVVPREQHAQGEAGERGARGVPGRGAGPHRAAVRRRAGRDRHRAGIAAWSPPRAHREQHLRAPRTSRRRGSRPSAASASASSAWPIRRWRAARRHRRRIRWRPPSARPPRCARRAPSW